MKRKCYRRAGPIILVRAHPKEPKNLMNQLGTHKVPYA